MYKDYIVAALALLLLQTALIAGLLLQRARARRMERALRENQQTLQESHSQISELVGRLIAAQETERSRIARDLHDDVSQRIAVLSLMISRITSRLLHQTAEADLATSLTSLAQNTRALADEIRHISHDLHPSTLQHAGLDAALSAFCLDFETMHPIAVTYKAGADVGAVDTDVALCLYRIAQEALHNVVKHAGARRVDVALLRTADGVQLSIADDGRGFDLSATRRQGAGLGLVSIDERARLLRGSVSIETDHRRGTRVQVRIPRPHQVAPAGTLSQISQPA